MSVAIGVVVASKGWRRLRSPGAYFRQLPAAKLLYPVAAMMPEAPSPQRVRKAHVEQVEAGLSEREWAIIRDVAALRLVQSGQLERLHFAELTDPSRAVVRRRVLARLVNGRVLRTLERRVGGARAGSTGLVYGLDTVGGRLVAPEGSRLRGVPGERFVRHVLDVSELYVRLVERTRYGEVGLSRFAAEPASWWPDGRGGVLKPDALVGLSVASHDDWWWAEVDRATESLPTIRRKLLAYVRFARGGQVGPGGVMPRVLVTVPSERRRTAVESVVAQLPDPARQLITVSLHHQAADVWLSHLRNK
jgi:hypothetical protein